MSQGLTGVTDDTAAQRTSTPRSRSLYEEARLYAPGGVQGNSRHFEPYPLYMKRGDGARLWDVDGNEYIDYHAAFGPSILGYAQPDINRAVADAAEREGVIFSLPHPREVDLAKQVCSAMPSAERVAFTCTGTEAVYHALRIARAHTGRQKVLKFEGGYHGWTDEVGVSIRPGRHEMGPARAPSAAPASAGSLPEVLGTILVAPYNDLEVAESLIAANKGKVASIIVEPVLHSCGCILPEPGFLEGLRQLASDNGCVLIFDEIVTAYRHHQGGCQAMFGVTPDLTCFGKAFSNGFPISGVAGSAEVMSLVGPDGPVYFSGTFNGHLLSVVAAQKTQEMLASGDVHRHTFRLTERLRAGVSAAIEAQGIDARCDSFGSVWSLYFDSREVRNYRDILPEDVDQNRTASRLCVQWLHDHGVYVQPFHVMRAYVSYAHTEEDIDRTVELLEGFFAEHRARLGGARSPSAASSFLPDRREDKGGFTNDTE